MSALMTFIQAILAWALSFFDWMITEFFMVLCAAVVTVISAIPLPTFFTNASTELSALPPGVLYFGQAAALGTGLPILLTAWGLRFLIRRLPFVG